MEPAGPAAEFTSAYTAMGTIMPPSAAMHGNAACRMFEREPSTSSFLISRPTYTEMKCEAQE